jgi:hypothetical protein
MITYTPDAKSLVFQELDFISTGVAARNFSAIAYDRIFDEVSQEIFNEFVAVEPSEVQVVQSSQTTLLSFENDMIEMLS